MLEPPAGLLAKGIAPRLWLRLGVPLIVPDMTGGISNDGRPLGERSGWLKVNQGDAHETGRVWVSARGTCSRMGQAGASSQCHRAGDGKVFEEASQATLAELGVEGEWKGFASLPQIIVSTRPRLLTRVGSWVRGAAVREVADCPSRCSVMEGPASFSAAATGHSGGLDRLGCQRCPAGVDLGTSARVGSCSGRLRCLGCPSWRGRRQAGGGGPWEAPGRGDSPFVSWAIHVPSTSSRPTACFPEARPRCRGDWWLCPQSISTLAHPLLSPELHSTSPAVDGVRRRCQRPFCAQDSAHLVPLAWSVRRCAELVSSVL